MRAVSHGWRVSEASPGSGFVDPPQEVGLWTLAAGTLMARQNHLKTGLSSAVFFSPG